MQCYVHPPLRTLGSTVDIASPLNLGNFLVKREVTKDELPAKPKKTASICPFCEQKGHKTMSAKSCLFSTKVGSPNYKEDNEERGIGKL